MKILALDPATKCGWAIIDTQTQQKPMSGTWDLSTKRDESTGMKLVRFKAKLSEMVRQGIDIVVFEAARNGAPHMQGALVHQAKLQGVLEEFCTASRIDYRGYSPTEVKKHATGKGNANKEAMIQAASRLWPIVPSDDNEADALCILHLGIHDYETDHTPF